MATEKRPGPGLLVAVGAMAAFAAYMVWAQNVAGHQGGPISPQKAIWLGYALATFYLMPAFLVLDRRLHPAIRRVYGWFLLSWILRGAGELYLMYAIHAWIPPYGVYHGIFNLGLIAFLVRRERAELARATGPADRVALRYLDVIRLTQLAEIAFALLFYWAVDMDTRTTWFAGGQDPRFGFINVLTATVEAILLPMLAWTVWQYYRPKASSRSAWSPDSAASNSSEG